jgi:hypothetical protein
MSPTTYRRSDGILDEVLDGRAALVNPEGTELLTLNEVGSVVWEALADEQPVDVLVDAVKAACENVPTESVDADVRRFLAELCALGLVLET